MNSELTWEQEQDIQDYNIWLAESSYKPQPQVKSTIKISTIKLTRCLSKFYPRVVVVKYSGIADGDTPWTRYVAHGWDYPTPFSDSVRQFRKR